MLAILRFHEREGDGQRWPTEWEYSKWTEIGRRSSPRGKQVRLPSLPLNSPPTARELPAEHRRH